MFSTKKAMSPLIATVLVIAFAVAIGVMIMNWTTSFEENGSQASSKDYCNGLALSVNPVACFDGSNVVIHVKNTGSEKFDGIMLNSVTESGELDFKIKDSSMIPRESADKKIPFQYSGGDVTINVVPFVMVEGSAVACLEGSYSQSNLPNCG
jgi:FlaG/FlaF family flagellin (archaellin)